MDGFYAVTYQTETAGKVQLIRQGLYVRVICRCRISGSGIYRLYARWDQGRENLGVLVPEGEGFCLEKRIPAKRLGEKGLTFQLHSRIARQREKLSPVYPEEPFSCIARQKDAFLAERRKKTSDDGYIQRVET